MEKCYSGTLDLSLKHAVSAEEVHRMPDFSNAFRCIDGDKQYSRLDQCLAKYARVSGDRRPWFQRFIQAMDWGRKHDENDAGYRYFRYEGILARGIYVDQVSKGKAEDAKGRWLREKIHQSWSIARSATRTT